MATSILDRRGRALPKIALTELRRRPGRFWELVERRGAVAINRDGESVAVALSLAEFVSLLFGMPAVKPHRKKKSQAKKHSKS